MRKLMLTPRNAIQRLQSAVGAAIANPVAKVPPVEKEPKAKKKATKKRARKVKAK